MPIQLAPSEQIAHSTVRIEVELADGKRGTGTGFFFSFAKKQDRHVPVIITNTHVVEGAVRGRFHLTTADLEGNPKYSKHEVFTFEGFQNFWVPHPEDDVDLCAMPIAPILEKASQTGKKLFFVPLEMTLVPSAQDLAELTAMEDVLMAGYPDIVQTPSAKFDSPKIRQTPSGESIADSVSGVATKGFGAARISESSSRKFPDLFEIAGCWTCGWAG